MSNPDAGIKKLLQIMDALRDPDHGCPWDLEQDFQSIAPHTLEEAYEVVDAIEQGDMAQLPDELGDLLFQVVFYARLGKESGQFDFARVTELICSKLLTRHPHVFPAGTLESAGTDVAINSEEVAVSWEKIKAEERSGKGNGEVSALDDVPQALPALLRARKLQKRAALQGFDWPDRQGVSDKIREEMQELEEACQAGDRAAIEEEFGDFLFSIVNLGRHLGLNPESALRAANRKFEKRYRALEEKVRQEGKEPAELSLDALEDYWQRVKVITG